MKLEKYKIDNKKIKEGIEELLKERINQITNSGGPFTLASAIDNYQETEQLAIRWGVNILDYHKKVEQYLNENFGDKK